MHLSVEDHGGSFLLPIHDEAFVSRFPDMAGAELKAMLELAEATEATARRAGRSNAPSGPRVCESRVAHDLVALRKLADSASPSAEVAS